MPLFEPVDYDPFKETSPLPMTQQTGKKEAEFIPIDYDPFAAAPVAQFPSSESWGQILNLSPGAKLTPVDYNPFESDKKDRTKPAKATAFTKLQEIKERPAQLVPFISSIDEMGYYLKLGDALSRLKKSVEEEERKSAEKTSMAAYGEALKSGEPIRYEPKQQFAIDQTKAIVPEKRLGPLTEEDLQLLKDFQDKQ